MTRRLTEAEISASFDRCLARLREVCRYLPDRHPTIVESPPDVDPWLSPSDEAHMDLMHENRMTRTGLWP